ncbi:MAG: hypothetical protein AAGD10_02970 [Myxococcota bacterium]
MDAEDVLPVLLAAFAVTPQFSQHWFDGNAEVAGYALEQSRYGQRRSGTVVLVFVTEPFSESDRVKADDGRHPDSDVFQVLKLNAVKDYQTGIYDYNLMTSVFMGLEGHGGRGPGRPAKITFSAQEWCGNTFEELLFAPERITRRGFSYFDGEGDQTEELALPANGITAAQLPILVRGIPEPLEPGVSIQRPLLRDFEIAVLEHRGHAVEMATIERSKERQSVQTPAGRFEVHEVVVRSPSGSWVYQVEEAFPHRIIRWRGPRDAGELQGVARLPYWQLNGEGGEAALRRIGLPFSRNDAVRN